MCPRITVLNCKSERKVNRNALFCILNSSHPITVIISSTVWLAELVGCNGKMENAYKVSLKNVKRRDHLGDLDVNTGEFLNQLSDYQILKKKSIPCS
jgi:hypothetical protein